MHTGVSLHASAFPPMHPVFSPSKKPDYFLEITEHPSPGHLTYVYSRSLCNNHWKFWSLYIFKTLAAVRRENTQLMHCTCLGRTPQRSSSLLDPSEKLCLWCYILCTLVASFFCFCIFHRNRKPLLFLSLYHKTKAKLLVRKYLHKMLSRHKFLVLTVSLCLPVVFGYKAQDLAEGEPVLRQKNLSRSRTGPQGEEGLIPNAT